MSANPTYTEEPDGNPDRPAPQDTERSGHKRTASQKRFSDVSRDVSRMLSSQPSSPVASFAQLPSIEQTHSRKRGSEVKEPVRQQQQEDQEAETPKAPPHVPPVKQEAPKQPATASEKAKDSVVHTLNDLQSTLLQYSRLIPFFPSNHPVRRNLKALLAPPVNAITRIAAQLMHSQNVLASNMAFDFCIIFFQWVINLFFREIRPRGAWRIPKDGACIFVGAPHNNQFVDPIMLWKEARFTAGRRVAFVTAASSMQRKFVGAVARTMQSVPVARAADSAKKGIGIVYIKSDGEDTILYGHKTKFTQQFEPRSQVMLPKSQDYAIGEVVEVIDDTHIRLKKGFEGKPAKALLAAGEALEKGSEIGLTYKALPHIDQSSMYAQVYKRLQEGGSIGIFPEGGSHDRTDLLPLKAGVSIMALGALSNKPDTKIYIIPTGLSYFHAHRFRSRAVVEFGMPITIPRDYVEMFEKGGQSKREAIGKVLDLVFDGLKSVTVRTPDFDTLMLIQATRRLYRPPGKSLSLGQVVDLNRRFITGYERYKDDPRVNALKDKVAEYNTLLRHMGLRDHQVERTGRPWWRSLLLLIVRSLLVTGWGLVALPGVVFNAPMFIAATLISRKKAKQALAASTVKIQAKDVVATWKILVSLGLAPVVYTIYGILAIILAHRHGWSLKYKLWIPFFMAVAVPSIGYSALKFGETGMDIYKSLRPLFVTLIPGNRKYIDRLKDMRAALSQEISDLVEELGPKVFDDFNTSRIVPSSRPRSTSYRKSTYGRDQGILAHPFEWLDDWIWGWSRDTPQSTSVSQFPSAMPSGTTTPADSMHEEADYDLVVALESRLKGARKRASSRTRSLNEDNADAAEGEDTGVSTAVSR